MNFISKKYLILSSALALSIAFNGIASAQATTTDVTIANFSSSCTDIHLDGSTLTANCQTHTGKFVKAAFDLDPWVTNTDSQLEWQLDPSNNGHYTATTSDCAVVPVNGVRDKYSYTVLACKAQKANGTMGFSRLLLDMFIENDNGKLVLRTDPRSPSCKVEHESSPIQAL